MVIWRIIVRDNGEKKLVKKEKKREEYKEKVVGETKELEKLIVQE